jgi:hypothetical protein
VPSLLPYSTVYPTCAVPLTAQPRGNIEALVARAPGVTEAQPLLDPSNARGIVQFIGKLAKDENDAVQDTNR